MFENSTTLPFDGISSSTATVTLNVTNQAPWPGSDYYSVLHDHTLTATSGNWYGPYPLLANDYDMDGDTLAITAINGNGFTPGETLTLASGASLSVNANGSFSYTPGFHFVGQDSVCVLLADNAS